MTNLREKESQRPIANCSEKHIINKGGYKFGFLGFADESWLDCLSPEIQVEDIDYVDYNESLRQHSKALKDAGCDFIVAINHMRLPED